MKDPCVDINEGAKGFIAACPAPIAFCNSPVSAATCGGLTNVDDETVTENIDVAAADYGGWYVNMDPEVQYPLPETIDTKWYNGERTITDPAATQTGIVYFTSFRPYKDPCEMGGITHLWAFLYDTGGPPTLYLKGKAIIQVSTGSIEQIDLATAFTLKGGRKTAGVTGVPPTAQGISVMAAPGAAKRPVHIRER
jgi:type IV pilus assembly protein PilY1